MDWVWGILRFFCLGMSVLIILRLIISWWTPENTKNVILNGLKAVTEPFLKPFRRFIPTVKGFDIVAILMVIILLVIHEVLPGGAKIF